MAERPRSARLLLLVPLLAVIVHVNTFGHGFTLDDIPIIEENARLRSLGNVPGFFVTHYWAGKPDAVDDGLYRPVTLATYAFQVAVHGLRPAPFHVVNVLLHALVAWMLVLFLRETFRDDLLAGIAGALFAVHAVHVEAVAGIVGRAELLALLGTLTCAWAYFRAVDRTCRDPGRWMAVSVAAFALGMSSKETGILAPVVILLTEVLLRARRAALVRRPVAIRLLVAQAFAALVFLVFRAHATGDGAPHEKWVGVAALDRVFTALRTCAEYVGLMVAPVNLSAAYWTTEVPLATSPFEPGVLVAVLVLLAAGVVTWWTWQRLPAVAWGTCVFALLLFPVSNLPFAIGVLKAERILYAPSLGFVVAVAAVAAHLARHERGRLAVLAVVALAVVVLSVLTWKRNGDWKDNATLAAATLRVSPESPRANTIYAKWLAAEGREEEAVVHLERALASNPYHFPALNNLGLMHVRLGQPEKAVAIYEGLVQRWPGRFMGYVNLLSAYRKLGQHEKALPVANAALQRFPSSAPLHWNAANVYQLLGRQEESDRLRARARELDPNVGK